MQAVPLSTQEQFLKLISEFEQSDLVALVTELVEDKEISRGWCESYLNRYSTPTQQDIQS